MHGRSNGELSSVVEPIIERLAVTYQDKTALRSAWAEEEVAIRAILQSLTEKLAGRVTLIEPLGVGGSGIVLRVHDHDLDLERALKFSRPSPGKEEVLAHFLLAETATLVKLSHPNLMRIYARGEVTPTRHRYPYYVMELFTDVLDLDKWVVQDGVTETQFLVALERVLDGITYMHNQGHVHLDIKPANILVTPQGSPIISDLGFAKVLRSESGLTLIGGTEGYIHPEARALLDGVASDPNRLRGEAERRFVRQRGPVWDLYSFGKTLLFILGVLAGLGTNHMLTRYTYRYLKLLACRLLDGHNSSAETVLGLSIDALRDLRISTAREALTSLQKLTGSYSLEAQIPELTTHVMDTIQVSTFTATAFTARVKAVVHHPLIQRLGGFTQLSLLNLVYPTATHTRLEHVIGTYSAVARYVSALYHDPLNPLFKQIMTEDDVKVALLAALLHDIGHYALAHDLEEADQKVFSHETRASVLLADRTNGLAPLVESAVLKDGGAGWGIEMARVLAVLNADPHRMEGTLKDRILHTLIDGPLDADKLDYLVRDSTNLGLPYGSVIDVERLLRCLTVVSRDVGGATYAALGIHEKGIVTAEAVAFARYALYGSVYWHHTYRSIKSMLKRIAWEYLEAVAVADEQRKEGIAKRIQAELDQLLHTSAGSPQLLPLMSLDSGAQIHPGDRAVLRWLEERSGTVGAGLVRLLDGRRLFKRILVLSRWGNENLWGDVSRLLAAQNDWRRKLKLQRLFQEEVLRRVEEQEEADALTTMVIPDARNRFIVAGRDRKEVLILVDGPPQRAGSTSGLEFIEEEDRRRAKTDELPVAKLERSTVWEALRDSLHQSIAKIRVFCHPDHSRFLSAYLSRSTLEAALEKAFRQLV